jgi:hypothetical protein
MRIGKHKYEKYIMTAMTGLCNVLKGLFLMGLLAVAILFAGCSMPHTDQIEENISASEVVCMNVSGVVLGKIKGNTTVALYKAEGFDYESIIGKISKGSPEKVSTIGTNQSFSFFCLPVGRYLLNIPAASYDYSFGSPIPVESKQGDLKVEASLNGGNSQNMFSAFSIVRIS